MVRFATTVKGFAATLAGSALALTAFVAPANAEARTDGQIIQPTEGKTQINLVGFNDFHGRITKVDAFAAGVLTAQDAYGADNTVIISSGDQFGASEFESSVDGDQPSKDALKALGVDVYTAGNHEFDKGQDDAVAIQQELGHMLATNVTKDGELLLDPYKIVEAGGLRVGVIGAVTAATPSAVTPSGIEGVTFSDPVEGVNKYADLLTDGDESNGEADILVASYHEGGPSSGSYEENAANEVFNSMVTGTSPKVSAIYHAHTHQKYNYDAPNGDSTRPVVQAASYADAFGQVVLTVDESGKVVNADSSVVETFADKEPVFNRDGLSPESQAIYDDVVRVQQDALAKAEVLGAEKIGVVNDDISRAYTWENGNVGGDDRAQESTLGSVVADSMHNWANNVGTEETKADLSIMNPGGLRADIAGDGTLTYKDAQTVLPFVNNLAIVSIKGEYLKEVFEQQWQRDKDGNVPGRPYLQLGMSSNVDYTYNTDLAEGSRITSIYIDGKALDPNATYKVVMPTFLAAGGDNFHSLTKADNVYDTGSVDLDAFVGYVKSLPNQELKPESTRNGFEVKDYFDGDAAPTVAAGAEKTFTVQGTDLRSKNFTADSKVEVKLDGNVIGEGEITGVTANGENNSAEVTFTVPESVAAGDYTIQVVAQDSGSTVNLPLTVTTPETPGESEGTATVTIDKTSVAPGDQITATATGFKPGTKVNFEFHSTPVSVGSADADDNGTAVHTFNVPEDATPGTHEVVATQDGVEARAAIEVVEHADPFVKVRVDEVTQSQSVKGIQWIVGNFVPGEPVTAHLVTPAGDKTEFDVEIDENGEASGVLTWAEFDRNGNLIKDNLPFPAGDYKIIITQGDVTVEAGFKVVEEAGVAPGEDIPGTDETAGIAEGDENGNGLAVTGADDSLIHGLAIAAAAATAAGAVLTIRRQRNA